MRRQMSNKQTKDALKLSYVVFGISILAISYVILGCAANKKVISEESKPVPVYITGPVYVTGWTYTVKKGDCLWNIAAKKNVYGDGFQWPLIYKENRDQINNPDVIEINQQLSIKTKPDESAIAEARQIASDTPKYKRK